MVFQQPMFPAKMPRAEPAVADDALRRVPALLKAASDLLRRHAPAQGQRHVQGRVGRDRVGVECGGGGREVLAGVDEAQVGG